MKSLVRRRTGPLHLDDAIALDDAVQAIESGRATDWLNGPDSVLESMPAMVLGQEHLAPTLHGRPLPVGVGPDVDSDEGRIRAYGTDGAFVAIMRFDATLRQWRPDKVFHS